MDTSFIYAWISLLTWTKYWITLKFFLAPKSFPCFWLFKPQCKCQGSLMMATMQSFSCSSFFGCLNMSDTIRRYIEMRWINKFCLERVRIIGSNCKRLLPDGARAAATNAKAQMVISLSTRKPWNPSFIKSLSTLIIQNIKLIWLMPFLYFKKVKPDIHGLDIICKAEICCHIAWISSEKWLFSAVSSVLVLAFILPVMASCPRLNRRLLLML